MHGLLFFFFFNLVGRILVQFSAFLSVILFYMTDVDEQKRFVKTYLNISGNSELTVGLIVLYCSSVLHNYTNLHL